jgi:hypothetical protein
MQDMQATSNGVQVQANGGVVTLTFNQSFVSRQAFEVLLQPSTRDTLSLSLEGRLFDGDGQLLARASVVSATLSPTLRSSAALSFQCVDASCTPVSPASVDLTTPPQPVFTVSGAAGDQLTVLAVGALSDALPKRDDLVLAASHKSSGGHDFAGVVYIFHGRDWSVPGFVSSSAPEQADTVIIGREGDQLGSAAAIGDVDGDGVGDLLVTAIAANGPSTGAGAGAAYLFSGARLKNAKLIDLNDAATFAATPRIFGGNAQEQLGSSVALAHLSSSANADLILGAAGAAGGSAGAGAGRVYVFFANTLLAAPNRELSAGNPGSGDEDATIFGATSQLPIGNSLAARDVAAPVGAEIAVGNEYEDMGKGAVYVLTAARIMGATLPRAFDLASSSYDLRVAGSQQAGWSVALADLEGAGAPDLIIGSRMSSTVYVVPIATALAGSTPAALDLTSATELAIVGPAGSGFGSALATGDLDGTGALDLLIGAPKLDGPDGSRAGAGAAYALTGDQVGHLTGKATQLSYKQLAVIFGANPGDALGKQVALGRLDLSAGVSQIVAAAPTSGSSSQGEVFALDQLPRP